MEGLVQLQGQQTTCTERGKDCDGGLDHDEGADGHHVQEPGQHGEHQAWDDSEGKPSEHDEHGPETEHHTEESSQCDGEEEGEEVAVVVVAHAPSREETVMVSAEDTLLTDGAMVGARRGVVLAAMAVLVAGLVDHWEGHAPAGRVRGDQQPVAERRVEEKVGHVEHGQEVERAVFEHYRNNVEHAVQVRHWDHYDRESDGHCVRRRTR